VKFTGVQLVTLAEGAITDLHTGLKGTMNAMYLSDLAAKSGDGMLRQRIHIGELVWNHKHRVVDPLTRQASKRRNAVGERVVTALPGLRIIEDELWERAHRRSQTDVG
jgi:hypothetical protein